MSGARPEGDGPTRGRSDVDLEAHRVEDDENVEYLALDHEVRYVASWGASTSEREAAREQGRPPEREPSYETTPADWWGYRECIEAAATRASGHVQDVLGTERVHWSVGQHDDDDLGAFVNTQTTLRSSGTVAETPDVDFDAVVEATPRTVRASYELDEFEYALDVPVFARHQVLQHD